MPVCTVQHSPRLGNDADSRRTIPQPPERLRSHACPHPPSVAFGARDSSNSAMVRSVLRDLQGHETRFHADVTDRDRDESSRRAISAWVRTNPQTQVR